MERRMWTSDTSALTLLETLGSPFSTGGFRAAVVASVPGWRDVSFGARAADGTLAAVALLARGREAESMPPAGYGGVVASRALDTAETRSFLRLVSRTLRVSRIRIRSLERAGTLPVGGRFAAASVVPIDPTRPPAAGYARLAQRSLKRATAAGAIVASPASFDAFWSVYEPAARGRGTPYPAALVHRLIAVGSARAHVVRIGEGAVASLLTLVGGSHWMCWLAGQSDEGRSVAASYLAYDAVLAEARQAGVGAVNLGASFGGGAEFKHHLGATELGMHEWTNETVPVAVARLARSVAAAAVARARAAHARAE
jgi:hypothetical protein